MENKIKKVSEILQSLNVPIEFEKKGNCYIGKFEGLNYILRDDIVLSVGLNDQYMEILLYICTPVPNISKKMKIVELAKQRVRMIHNVDGIVMFEKIRKYKDLIQEFEMYIKGMISPYTRKKYDKLWAEVVEYVMNKK